MGKVCFAMVSIVLLLPSLSLANGGDQRVVDGRYLINLSRAPFTPRAGEKVSMLISFVDIQKNKLIREDLTARIRIAKLGGIGTERRTFFFEQSGIGVQGGVLEFPYVFAEPGLHEVFIDFTFASNPQEVHEVPDFLLDVQKAEITSPPGRLGLVGALLGIAIGFLAGWFGRRMVGAAV